MGCGASLWLLISCYWVWGMSCGMMETVLGTLGKATVLGIPPEFQEFTQHSGTATWKRSMGSPLNKEILFTYYNGNYTNFKPGQNRFHPSNFSLEILSTQRQDQQLYEYSVTMESKERNWHIQLEVYEPVSDPSIHILGWTLANDNCTVTLNCTAARGDSVSYSWTSASALCSHNGSLLQLSYNLTNSILPCTCVASNPVSHRTVAFYPSVCSAEHWGESLPTPWPRPCFLPPPTPQGIFHIAFSIRGTFCKKSSLRSTVSCTAIPVSTEPRSLHPTASG